MERVRKVASLAKDFAISYRYFLLSFLVLIFLPYSASLRETYDGSRFEIAGLFYFLSISNGQFEYLAFANNPIPLILNIAVITGSCLYFTFYRKRATRTGTDYSLNVAGLYFVLVIVTLLIVDWNGTILGYYITGATSYLSIFGFLLAYLTIVIPVFQKLSKEKIIPATAKTTNRYKLYIYRNVGSVFGFIILLSPIILQLGVVRVDVDSFDVAFNLFGSAYSIYSVPYSVFEFSNSSFKFIVGMSPQLFSFALFWGPQIILVIQLLRYLGGQTSKRFLIVGFLISLLPFGISFPMTLMWLFGGLSSIIVPLPILQLLTILVLRIEKSDTGSVELEIEPQEDEMVKVPIRHLLLSRIRNRRNSDW